MEYVDQLSYASPARVEIGISLQAISRQGSERLIRSAIQYALRHRRKKLTIIHNGNTLKFTEGAFTNWGFQLAEQEFGEKVFTWANYDRIAAIDGYPAAKEAYQNALDTGRLIVRDMLADQAIQQAIIRPAELDMLVAPGIHGDALHQLLTTQVAGNGILPVASLNAESKFALFEPSHGPVAALARKNQMNPTSMILAGAMLLSHIGWEKPAIAMEQAVKTVIANKRVTADLAEKIVGANLLSCSEFAEEVRKQLR